MKKIYLFVKGAKRWNSLLKKFSKLHKRLQLLSTSNETTQYQRLVQKLQRIYSKLEKMQYQTGVKIATTSLAIILSAYTAQAQFAEGQLLKKIDSPISQISGCSPTFADIDGDGDLDLYVGESIGRVRVFTNTNGIFTAVDDLQAGGLTIDAGFGSVPAFADIDADGDLDLYIGVNSGVIKVYTNTNGAFTFTGDLQAGGSIIDIGFRATPTFADIDDDGDLDLYVGEGNGDINFFTNTNGVFTAAGNLQADGSSIDVGTSSRPAFADIDDDGDLDLYVGDNQGYVKIFTNSNGVFSAAGDLQINGSVFDAAYYSSPTFADIDGDGDLDLYVGNSNSNIELITNNNGVFTSEVLLTAIVDINVGNSSSPTFADVDADGDLDLYVGESSGRVRVFTNTNGVFTEAGDLEAGSSTIDVGSSSSPTFADIDADGDLDLYSGYNQGRVRVYTNANGVFTAASDLSANGSPIDVGVISNPTFADIDADGDLDLYIGQYYNDINVFTNNNGVFTAAGVLQAGGSPINAGYGPSPTFADIDADGDLDLYVGEEDGTIKVFTNTNGVFTAASDLQANGSNIDVGIRSTPTFADIDADGDLDLYVGAVNGTITFFENMSIVLVNSISIQSAGNINTITTNGGTLQMSATVLPVNADDGSFTWSVVNGTGSATIDANGLLTAVADGTVEVIATANDASGETASFTVTISNQTAQAILVSSITIEGAGNASTITTNGGTLQMNATVLPANADDGSFTWSVVNGTGSATIDANGLLTATANGTVDVVATANDASGETGSKTITISNQTVGINDVVFENLNIFPNPTNGIINLNVSEELTSIKIMDLTGKTIKEFNAEAKQLDISGFTTGIYFLEIGNDERKSVVKIVKQ